MKHLHYALALTFSLSLAGCAGEPGQPDPVADYFKQTRERNDRQYQSIMQPARTDSACFNNCTSAGSTGEFCRSRCGY